MSENADTLQIKPLNPHIAVIWENAWSDYPDMAKIPMEDGKVITYRREIVQPEPRVQKCVDLIRAMQNCTYGGYKPKHIKNDRRCCNTDRPENK